MNSLTIIRQKSSDKTFELPAQLIMAIEKALDIGTSRTIVCKMSNLSEKKFDKWVTLGQRLWDMWHDGKRDFTLWEQGCMEFSKIVVTAEARWLIKVQSKVDAGLDATSKVAQGRYAMEILERRDNSEWGKRAILQVNAPPAPNLLNPTDAEKITVDELEEMRQEAEASRSEEIKKRMQQ